MKHITASITTFILLQSALPTLAQNVTFVPNTDATASGALKGSANLKVIGPLHMSDGLVKLKGIQITVLSDGADADTEAELSGILINPHLADGTGQSVGGYAVFTKGFSFPALNSNVDDLIVTSGGTKYAGRIVSSNGTNVTMRTAGGATQDIPANSIASIKSPRAFAFSVPLSDTASLISFSPTFEASLDASPKLKGGLASVHEQLNERHVGKTVLKGAAAAAAISACFAIPLIIGAVTPKNFQEQQRSIRTTRDIRRRGGIDKLVSDAIRRGPVR